MLLLGIISTLQWTKKDTPARWAGVSFTCRYWLSAVVGVRLQGRAQSTSTSGRLLQLKVIGIHAEANGAPRESCALHVGLKCGHQTGCREVDGILCLVDNGTQAEELMRYAFIEHALYGDSRRLE